ncbi:DNA repair protein REV1 [Geosmithia morbida]|uniref:DNA repair protein REV1 n=1 Tax=Geosmithia morbida TaxID=1094350 RepID=A0A9P4YSN7_9HYPO|nr:DNA repair protein REV1 [Geosmithia morbida]KAF4122391.1 DNA repair protein REV1 [Geosmithia morbida]
MGRILDKNSTQSRKRIESHVFEDEAGEEYEESRFNGFGDYFRRKKIKLQNLDADMRSSSDKPQLFKGIVAHVTGYTQPPLHILHREIVEHGGGFLQYLDSKTMATHIITSSLPPKKTVDFSGYRIVKPSWIVDSIIAGALLPWSDYRVLDEGPRQKILKLDSNKGLSQQQTSKAKRGYCEQTEKSFYTAQLQTASSSGQLWRQAVEENATPGPSRKPSDIYNINELGVPGNGYMIGHVMENNTSNILVTDATSHNTTAHDGESNHLPRRLEPPRNVTSEEHNAWLLSDPKMRKSSTANPDFLKQFYSESRLHHLSTWKMELKSRMQRMAIEKGSSSKPPLRKPGSRKYIMHVDFDSFFCAVSLKKHPELVDSPVAVAHGTGNGSEIASCNYPARRFGVKNGMWMKRALEICGELKVLPYDFPAYEEASHHFYESILDVGGIVQSVSVDEALIDVTSIVLDAAASQGIGIDEGSIWREQEKVDKMARRLRESVKTKTGCHVSVGIGANILQAKVALRKAKPAGQYQLKPEAVLDVIGQLKVEELPGVAYSIGSKLEEAGVKLVKDLRDVTQEKLLAILGPKTGEKLRDYARGIDKAEVGEMPPRKSVSAEVSWGVRFVHQQEAEEFVYNLCEELERRLLNEQVRGKLLTMRIMRRALDAPLDPVKHLGHGKCDLFSKSTPFGVATNNYKVIGKKAVSILRSFKFNPGDLRGLGVQMTKLEPIKSHSSAPDGSQPKLMFSVSGGQSAATKMSKHEPIDEIKSDRGNACTTRGDHELDSITDDPRTSRKNKVHPAMALARAGEDDSKATTHLNVSGTQFIIPSNADPAIIAELPNNIRSKLMAQKPADSSIISEDSLRRESLLPDVLPSQLDAEVFNALPDDVKAEVLETYGRKPAPPAAQRSPGKGQQSGSVKKSQSPAKKGRIKDMFGKAQRQSDVQAGLLPTNFRNNSRPGSEAPLHDVVGDLDSEFLSELPEDVRREVIEDHQRQQLAQISGLDAPMRRPKPEVTVAPVQRRIHFPAAPPRISFDSSKVTSLPEIKDMLDAWHTETSIEGPHHGDAKILEKYIWRVIREERDMEKAIKIIKWLDVLVEQDGVAGDGQNFWRVTVKNVKVTAQEAVKLRGLPPLDI